MVNDKVSTMLMFLWLFVTVYLINGGLILAFLISVAVLVGRLIGKATKTGVGKLTAEKRFKQAKFFPTFVLLIFILFWLFAEMEGWRMLLLACMFLIMMVFELTDSYLWYKKEQESAKNESNPLSH
ncbi:hypothetical protein [Alkalicoccobacillus murimartini]|uniref:Ca2+/Na+ antiporter n=1 Tax=Alkalicoccobacillus murimartini TaxID=171685 RepID=A0ABT9YH85_9BACI|nr:hypothetical protein [Alkalicoccobacillus murimartini]MDQ0207056.1 Ca2+/Na+ antiporter [Alkalicoccobacillus murimartini]